MPSPRELSLGEYERKRIGCIVTAREQWTGELHVVHRSGTPREALRAISDELAALEGDWRVLSISTPATIYRDLQGTRQTEGFDRLALPELQWLHSLGRFDLLDPSLEPRDKSQWRTTYGRPFPDLSPRGSRPVT